MTDPMSSVDQTNPATDQPFGERVYRRGVIADGGRATEETEMSDVDQAVATEGSRRAFERGSE